MFKELMEVINEVDNRIWALVVIVCGLGACLMKQNEAGTMLIGGGLSAFQQKPAKPE